MPLFDLSLAQDNYSNIMVPNNISNEIYRYNFESGANVQDNYPNEQFCKGGFNTESVWPASIPIIIELILKHLPTS